MTDWQRKIYLQPEWGKAEIDEITHQQLAKSIAAKLRLSRPFRNENIDGERDEIVSDMECIAGNDSATADDFDEILDRLYDWGDTHISGAFFDAKKVCWIDRFSDPTKVKAA